MLEGFITLETTLSLHGAFRSIWNNHWAMSVLYTNNLFVIAKCAYATPDPVQPDHQYLRVHYIYFALYLCPILYTPVLTKQFNLYVIQLFMCTSPPCSLQSLSLDLLSKMSTSLAQNKTMVKLTIKEDICHPLVQVQDVKLFTRHLLLGLSGNNTLTDLTLSFPSNCWDWPEGELNVLHC